MANPITPSISAKPASTSRDRTLQDIYPKTSPAHLAESSPAGKAAHHVTRTSPSSPQPLPLGERMSASSPTGEGSPSPLFPLPLHGAHNPSSTAAGTTPGSFALAPNVGGPLMFASPDTPGMPAPSTKTAWDFLPDGWSVERLGAHVQTKHCAGGCNCNSAVYTTYVFDTARGDTLKVTVPASYQLTTQLDFARIGKITPEMLRVAEREPHLTPAQIRDEIAAGRLIIPANIHHLAHNLDPMAIGRASRTKVNANMGASPISSSTDEEVEKLRWAEQWGADTVMDLSTGGDLDATRAAILAASTVPIGTVPIYSMIIGRRIEDLTRDVILSTIEHQAKQGVDYMTIHAGVRKAHLPYVRDRLIGIVSRGGSLLAKWMLVHDAENPMYTLWDDICEILHRHDVSFSIGDGLRPGGLADATDNAQLAELSTIAELTERAWRHGVQVMVEGPGHVPLDQIEYNMKLQRALCHGAPFYVLGPLVTDVFPGYDHITSAIGATNAAWHGAAMLCYVTPKEHLGLPKRGDVKEGCIAYKIAAHAADVALGIPGTRDWDDNLTRARAALNWEKHFDLAFDADTARAYHDEDLTVDTDFCAMCGHDWCSVRISKEIQEFASGKAAGFERLGGKDGAVPGAPKAAPALTPDQQAILAARGYLTPDEIHAMADRTRKAVGAVEGKKADCHSDYVEDPEAAKKLQKASH